MTPHKTKHLKRGECAILSLVLKGHWFNLISSGLKREEYRDFTKYWTTRISNWDLSPRIHIVEFRRGYSASSPRIAYQASKVMTIAGFRRNFYLSSVSDHPEWGEPSKPHFVIRLKNPITLI